MNTATTTQVCIRAEDLVVSYGNRFRGRRPVLKGVDVAFGPGVHGLLGPNGAGKTTLIRVLATVLEPTSGLIQLDGADLRNAGQVRQLRRKLGYLPQNFGFYPRFTVREFVEYVAWLKEMPSSAIPLAVDRALDRADLQAVADQRMGRVSGGVARRVGIAQAIVNDPAILLLDEPTVGLDPEQRLEFRAVVSRIGLDACVVLSTHLIEDVAAACSDVAVMDDGRIVYTGTTQQLLEADHSHELGVGDTPTERAYTAVLRNARAQGRRP